MNRAILAVTIGLVLASSARAAPYWSTASVACTPDRPSIQSDRYTVSSDDSVKHRGNNVDRIVVNCGVSPNASGDPPNVLTISHVDSTGTGTKAWVSAQLIGLSRTNGTRQVITQISSDSVAQASFTEASSPVFVHALDFDSNYYFVRLEIDRSSDKQSARSIGVALEAAEP